MFKRMNWKHRLLSFWLFGLALVFLAGAVPARGAEKILSFHSDIKINGDASLTVTETIRVRAENDQIKRGIYRDFPTRYREKYGLTRRVGFRVLQVLRDERPEAFHLEGSALGQRVYMGRKEVILNPGDYTYTLVYETDRQLGFFSEFDELYWNVTGNDWNFPIEKASATVHLPEGAGGRYCPRRPTPGRRGRAGRISRKKSIPTAVRSILLPPNRWPGTKA